MFREPAARMASGFVHDFHSCNWLMVAYWDCITARRDYKVAFPYSCIKNPNHVIASVQALIAQVYLTHVHTAYHLSSVGLAVRIHGFAC